MNATQNTQIDLNQFNFLFISNKIQELEKQILFLIHIQYPNIYKITKTFIQYDTFIFGTTIPLISMINKILEKYTPTYLLKFTYDNKLKEIIDIKLKGKTSKHIKIEYIKILQLLSQDISGKKLQAYIDRQYKYRQNID